MHFLRTGRTDKKPHVVSLNSPPLHQMQHTLALGCSMRTGGTPHGAGANSLRSDPMVEKNAPALLPTFFHEKFRIVPFLFKVSYCTGSTSKTKESVFCKKGPCGLFSPTYSSIFQDLQSPLSGEKKCEHFSSPEKKNIWRRGRTLKSQHRLGRPSETRRPGVRLWRPGGYLRFTFGLR